MGMEQTVQLAAGSSLSWPAARDLLASRGLRMQVRMIDNQLAFPDEEPSDAWRELRLSTAEGAMVTVRREPDRVVLTVWGNADAQLTRSWNALTWAFAVAGSGQIHTKGGLVTPDEYARCVETLGALGGVDRNLS